MTITIGVVGRGRIAERNLEAYRKLGDVRAVAADQVPEATRRLPETQETGGMATQSGDREGS